MAQEATAASSATPGQTNRVHVQKKRDSGEIVIRNGEENRALAKRQLELVHSVRVLVKEKSEVTGGAMRCRNSE